METGNVREAHANVARLPASHGQFLADERDRVAAAQRREFSVDFQAHGSSLG